MDHTLTISEKVYSSLQALAVKRGLQSVEQLLEILASEKEDLRQRQAAVQRINALREHLTAIYGEMPDSTDLLREDRER